MTGEPAREADDDVARRVFAALAAQQWDVAVGLVELHWARLIRAAPHVVQAVVFALPPQRRNSRRWRNLSATRQLILRTAPSPASPGPHAGELLLYLAALTEQASNAMELHETSSARAVVRQAVAFHRALTEEQRRAAAPTLPGHLLRWARVIRAVGDGDGAESRNLLEEAYAWSVSTGRARAAIESAGELAADDALLGRTSSARQWVRRATMLHRANVDASGTPPAVEFALALMSADRLAFDRALGHLAQSASVPFYDHGRVTAAFRVLWRSFQAAPDRAALIADLDRSCESPARSHLGQISEVFARVRLDLLDGNRHGAITRLTAVTGDHLGGWTSAARAALHLRLGDIRAAELDASFARERVADSPRSIVELRAIQATLHLRKNQPTLARSTFREAVAMAELHQLPAGLLAIPLTDLRALAETSYRDEQPPLVRLLLSTIPDVEAAGPATAKLTPRELAVLRALDARPDASTADIAARLGVSRNTIKTQLRSIYRKVGTSDRSRAVHIVREAGIVGPSRRTTDDTG